MKDEALIGKLNTLMRLGAQNPELSDRGEWLLGELRAAGILPAKGPIAFIVECKGCHQLYTGTWNSAVCVHLRWIECKCGVRTDLEAPHAIESIVEAVAPAPVASNLLTERLHGVATRIYEDGSRIGCYVSPEEAEIILAALRAAPETGCSATWQPIVGGPVIPCTLPAGHAGKHRAPEPFSEEESITRATERHMDFAVAVTRNAMLEGLARAQFLRLAAIAWDVHEQRSAQKTTPAPRRKAPFHDFTGAEIHEGDVIVHPTGERGTVVFLPEHSDPADQWRAKYGDEPGGSLSRLCLQIGDKGQAVVVKAKPVTGTFS